ncbi:MAG TPA: serine/threonine-protein kinase [Urbifossiella sp.]|nr:serine/threonine-protein kinase [Urbifossiella sp.]
MPTPPDVPLPSTAGTASAQPPEPGTEILVSLCRRWQEARTRGAHLDPELLCQDHPDLLPDLRMAIEVLEAVSDVDPTGPASPGSTVELPAAGGPPRLAGYEVTGVLGSGAMGVVYKARQAGLNRDVALKVVRGPHRDGSRNRLRFLAEAEAAAAVTHSNVVRVHGYGEADGHPYLVLEYLDGGTLAGRVAAGRLDARAAAALVARIAAGVQAVHDQGIVHRDLKPGNILFDGAGEPKMADFGLAKFGAADLTQTGVILGTPAYMAPEQARGRRSSSAPRPTCGRSG